MPEAPARKGRENLAMVVFGAISPVVLVLVVVLRPRPVFGWRERTFRLLLSRFISLQSWRTRLPQTRTRTIGALNTY
jgi:hypothetical protein